LHFRHSLETTFVFVPFVPTPVFASADGDLPRLSEYASEPFLSAADILFALHILRC
jgi:hypothetical protein